MRSNHSVLRTIALMAGAVGAFQLATAGTTAEIPVKEAWVRWLPANAPGGGYFTLANIGSTEPNLRRYPTDQSRDR
jgi:copper(I)-binding protein